MLIRIIISQKKKVCSIVPVREVFTLARTDYKGRIGLWIFFFFIGGSNYEVS